MTIRWFEHSIPIDALTMWDENARFPDKYFKRTEAELIEYFFSKPQFKLLQFIEEVVRDFDLPQLEKLVVFKSDERSIVLEGNRRLAAYKVLNNPTLAPNQKLRDKVRKLAEKVDISPNFELECLVTASMKEGYRFVDRKHMKGNNEVDWGDNERTHHNARQGKASAKELFKVEINKILKGLDIPDEVVEKVLGPGFVTTFWRILESRPSRDEFGFKIDKVGALTYRKKNFPDLLKVIIANLLLKKDFSGNDINTRTLNKDDQIQEYLESIGATEIKKAEKLIKSWVKPTSKKKVKAPKKKTKHALPKSTIRHYLIPTSCILVIKEPKINNVYLELKESLLLDDSFDAVPNAVGVMFRVFLEISLDYFADKKGFAFASNTKLSGKINKVSGFMEKKGLCKSEDLKMIRKVATNNQTILSIDNFHSYVHDYKAQPSSSDLKLKWDNLQSFFELLWDNV